jgi:hypothetical protein
LNIILLQQVSTINKKAQPMNRLGCERLKITFYSSVRFYNTKNCPL